ncbi:MAG: hypothetical protein D6814_04360 [Calditrichaeota bacterium]|nr:MAG: hypothetical protein D6814_04360 [Calditrichota bacterium]
MFVSKRILVGLVFLCLPQIVAAQDITLQPIKPRGNKPCLYRLEFSLSQELKPKAWIYLHFPTHYDLSKVKIAGSNDIKGGISFAVDSTGISFERSGLGPTIARNQRVSIIFGPVKNRLAHTAVDSVDVQVFFNGKEAKSNHQAFRIGSR